MSKLIDTGIFVHPWDLAEEGAEQVLASVAYLGLSRINLATSYHTGRYILPHNPKHPIYYAEEGVIYFQADEEEYFSKSRVKPIRSKKFQDIDIVEIATRQSKNYGLKVNSWTVTLHNSKFVELYPDLAMVDAYGNPDQNFICPSNPETMTYLVGLIRNLAERYEFNAIQLESIGYPWSLRHNDEHEIFGTQLEPLVSELLTTCFCKKCQLLMEKMHLSPSSMKKLVTKIVETSFNTPSNILQKVPPEEILRNSFVLSNDLRDLDELINFKHVTVERTLTDLKSAVKDSGKAKLRLLVHGGSSTELSVGRGCEGINLSTISKIADGIDLVTYVKEPENVFYQVQWSKFEVEKNCPLHACLRINNPVFTSQTALESQIKMALDAGAAGLEFYNYGWTNKKSLESLKQSLMNTSSSSHF